MRKTWETINSVIRPASHIPNFPNKQVWNENIVEDPNLAKHSLAYFFASVGGNTEERIA